MQLLSGELQASYASPIKTMSKAKICDTEVLQLKCYTLERNGPSTMIAA